MAIKRAEMGEFFAELCKFILFTGFFYWLLTNGPAFSSNIIDTLYQVGGDAGGTKGFNAGAIIELGMQVFQNTLKHINFLARRYPVWLIDSEVRSALWARRAGVS